MNLYRIANLSRYQHYTQRRPPWIKWHRECLDNPEFMRLQDASKWLAVACVLLASESENGAFTSSSLAWRMRSEITDENLQPLLDVGFIERCKQSASKSLARRKQDGVSEKRRGEKRRGRGEKRRLAPGSSTAGAGSFRIYAADAWQRARDARPAWGRPEAMALQNCFADKFHSDTEKARSAWDRFLADTEIATGGHDPKRFAANPSRWVGKKPKVRRIDGEERIVCTYCGQDDGLPIGEDGIHVGCKTGKERQHA